MKSIYEYATVMHELLAPLSPEQREAVILMVYEPVPDAPRVEVANAPRGVTKAEPKSAAERQTQIMDLLRGAGGEAKNADIARALGISQQAMTKYLVALANAGCIVRTHGASRLTATGRAGVWR